ncbi:P-loop containing nucleoside triphosphate hydrolases superfamily protein [Perilla frutescens var. hirtella]|nr:P-loop containing nucleoside triphosphate hydrolases superfamily protein [Perilla frutescens var. frutescens]KAH6784175.1 P-loop containing nucleoside triphosphate hydrolases superfamily protein [Perilla frutescens var. hirtella]
MRILVQCQEQQVFENDYNGINTTQLSDPTVLNEFTELVYNRLSAVTSDLIHTQIAQKASFCITDPELEWNKSFNYSSKDFLSKCIAETQGDLPQRLCTAAELKFYFTNFIASARSASTFLKPNRNCNSTTWVSGCEPGWACSSGFNQPVHFTDSQDIPARTSNCQPCCEGFFCPQGLTCMIPCPLGSYCPRATHNALTGLCDPYMYQLPQGQPNHTCGGANIWADVSRGGSMFCSAGSYCPTSIQEIPCSSRHYCRMGSNHETRCYRLTSCDSNTSRQNISQYGYMLIIGISVTLLVFYNCYEKVITIRERKYARSREIAVKSVKENARAQARWLAAKEAIIKRAAEISHSFSRRTVVLPNDLQLGAVSGRKEIEAGYPPVQEIEDFRDSFEGGDKDTSRVKVKHIRTDTQIFKYAYSQLELEKVQQLHNKDLTFSGGISMAMDTEMRRRPTIEISFRDLTVTLKQKKIRLLRSVNGEILPGRITALMGPSGAGKTTLLSALAGKTVGCSITGLVLINGKVESIRSYKKIVGFVPQDDVVHGNLTVEENIWFSANCRLSATLIRADKVLIVERVIESLGLQPVRNSLVGTVEKRGISGGQRKRVNVGLELVMEPSLLFLDEPTSGLDSSSSQLLLRALKREAFEGVNICMVVHQPSYSLFNMFDDLILLAKGGLTAYHGAVRDVEDYFANLGINVPDHINPPDYFIDVLEGMVKPHTSSGVTYEELPLRWMLHKGYPVPPDMQKTVPGVGVPAMYSNSGHQENPSTEQLSFWGEFWQNMKYRVEARVDVIQNNFLKSNDLSRRRTPSIVVQYWHFLGRMAKQRLREARIQAIDYLILLLAGACLGLLAKSGDESFGAPGYTYTIIATSLLCKIAALRTFSLDKLQYRRERASGISSLAHFVAKDTIDHFSTLIKPLVYLSMFYFFSNPRSTFLDNYIVLLCLVYCVTGIAYMLAIFLEPGPSQLCSVLLPVVLTLLSTQPKDSQFIKILTRLCYPSWALEAFIVSNAKSYSGVWLIQRCGALLRTGYNLHDWKLCISLLMALGAACRVLAFIGMLALQKK